MFIQTKFLSFQVMICLCAKPKKSKTKSNSPRSFCCCCGDQSHKNNSHDNNNNNNIGPNVSLSYKTDNHLSIGDHNSFETDTAASEVLNSDSTKQYCISSSDSTSANSSHHSKEYFTIGNRFDQSNLTALLNATVPDETEDEMNTFHVSGTLGRPRATQNGLPNKSFNTYASNANASDQSGAKSNGKNSSGGAAGLTISNNRLSANANILSASSRVSNYGIVTGSSSSNTGTIRTSMKQPRNSFAFTMRTNLDQEL